MPTKIETHLTPVEFREFCARCAQTKAGTTLRTIQALAEEFGVTISLMSATAVRDGPLAEYLDELKATASMAESVAALAKNGVGLSDGAASAFAAKVFDAARHVSAADIGSKEANNLSLAISRLRTGDQRAAYLNVKVRELEQKIDLQQFDAAAAVLAHAKEIKLVVADTKLDAAAKTERVRSILFGARPADWKPTATTGAQTE